MTCLALQYHTVGSEGLRRLQELDSKLLIATADAGKNADLVKLRQTAFEDKAAATVELRQAARQSLMDAQRDFDAGRALVTKLAEERSALPDRLWKWSQQPCEVALLRTALCSRIDGVSKGDELKSDIARTAAAITIVRWMNEILLPLLLGWLGAYAFVIRQMTSEISARSFAKASSLRHITRLALGALAGIASSWLLTNDVFSGQLKNVPAWVLAFVAGYGIELVFAFLDRIITAFTKKES